MSAKPRARGFIAEDTAAVDGHLATYDAAGAVSGIDDRSILAVLVGAIKQLWSKVLALIESDERQAAEMEALKARVSELEAAAGAATAQPGGAAGALGGSSASNGEVSTDTATSTTPVIEEEDADAPAGDGQLEAPASGSASSLGSDTESVSTTTAPPAASPAADRVSPPSTAAANDNEPSAQLPATGTE
jgi:hypothetical protein